MSIRSPPQQTLARQATVRGALATSQTVTGELETSGAHFNGPSTRVSSGASRAAVSLSGWSRGKRVGELPRSPPLQRARNPTHALAAPAQHVISYHQPVPASSRLVVKPPLCWQQGDVHAAVAKGGLSERQARPGAKDRAVPIG